MDIRRATLPPPLQHLLDRQPAMTGGPSVEARTKPISAGRAFVS
jgi:hypothetical protein